MANRHAETLKLIEDNYTQAAKNYFNDMAATTTPQQAQKIDQNYSEAEAAWARAMVDVLSRSNPQVDAAKKDLKKANDAVKAARAGHEAIANLTAKLQVASSLAGTLVRIAAL